MSAKIFTPLLDNFEASQLQSLGNTAIYFSESIQDLPGLSKAIEALVARGAWIMYRFDDDLHFTNNLIAFAASENDPSLYDLRGRIYPRVWATLDIRDIGVFMDVCDIQVSMLHDVGRPRPYNLPVNDDAFSMMVSGGGETEYGANLRRRMLAKSLCLKSKPWMQEVIGGKFVRKVSEQVVWKIKNVAKVDEVEIKVKEEKVIRIRDLKDMSPGQALKAKFAGRKRGKKATEEEKIAMAAAFLKESEEKDIKDQESMDGLCHALECSFLVKGEPISTSFILAKAKAEGLGWYAPGANRTHIPAAPMPMPVIAGKARSGAAAKYSQAVPGTISHRTPHAAAKPVVARTDDATMLKELMEGLKVTVAKTSKKRHAVASGSASKVKGSSPRRVSGGKHEPIKTDDDITYNISTPAAGEVLVPPATPLVAVFDLSTDFISFDLDEQVEMPQLVVEIKKEKVEGKVKAQKVKVEKTEMEKVHAIMSTIDKVKEVVQIKKEKTVDGVARTGGSSKTKADRAAPYARGAGAQIRQILEERKRDMAIGDNESPKMWTD